MNYSIFQIVNVCGDPCALGGSLQVLTSIDANILERYHTRLFRSADTKFRQARFHMNADRERERENNAWNNARNACHARNVILTPIDRMKIIIDIYRRGADADLVNEK